VTTINVRRLDAEALALLRKGATVRGLTYAEYIKRLLELHQAARARADAGDDGLQAELKALGLETVKET
jgi:hypothetical protein